MALVVASISGEVEQMHWLLLLALAASHEAYTDAHTKAVKEDIPLVALLGADWCEPCLKMKKK